MLQEGIEEVNTQYAEAEGKRVGEGKNRRILTALGDLEQYYNDVTNQEGALNFFLGAVGGGVQTVLLDAIRNKKIVELNAEGKPVYTRVTTRKANEFNTRKYYESVKDAFIADIERIEGYQDDLAKAKLKNDPIAIQRAKDNLFNVSALNAVAMGRTESWEQQYREIAAIDNSKDLGDEMQPQIDESAKALLKAQEDGTITEEMQRQHQALIAQQQELTGVTIAMQKGLAKDQNDNGYKEEATNAVATLKELNALYTKVDNTYNDHLNPETAELSNHIFTRKANLLLQKKALDKFEAELINEEAFDVAINGSMLDREISTYNSKIESHKLTVKKLEADRAEILSALQRGDSKTLLKYIEKYQVNGYDETDLPSAITALAEKISTRVQNLNDFTARIEKDFEETTAFKNWLEKNPEKDFKEYASQVYANEHLKKQRATLQYHKEAYAVAAESLNHIESAKGQDEFIARTKADIEAIRKQTNDKIRKQNAAADLRQATKENNAELAVKSIQNQIVVLKQRRAKLVEQLKKVKQQITDAYTNPDVNAKKTSLSNFIFEVKSKLLMNGNLRAKRTELNDLIDRIDTEIDILIAELPEAEQRLETVQAEATLPEEEQTPEPQGTAEKTIAAVDNAEAAFDAAEAEKMDALTTEYNPYDTDQSDIDTSKLILKPEELAYYDLVDTMPDVVPVLDKLYREFQTVNFSLQHTMQELGKVKTVTDAQRREAALALKNYLEFSANERLASAAETEESAASTESVEDTESIDGLIPLSEDLIEPTLGNYSVENVDEVRSFHAESNKSTDAVKGNYSTLQYRSFEHTLPDGTTIIVKRNDVKDDFGAIFDTNMIGKQLQLLVPGAIKAGDELEIYVNTEWDGEVTNTDKLEQDDTGKNVRKQDKFEDYVDSNGKIRMSNFETGIGYGNVPIKIVHKATGAVTYLPRTDWVNSTAGAENYENMGKGEFATVEENVEEQTISLLDVRFKIANLFNQKPDHKIQTTVTERTTGQPFLNSEVNLNSGKTKIVLRSTANQLPDTSLKMAILTKEGKLMTNLKEEGVNVQLFKRTQTERFGGSPVVLLPSPSGKLIPYPLSTKRMGNGKSVNTASINTVVRAIELFLQNGTDFADELHQKQLEKIETLGFDLKTETGLKNFIHQYFTHTSKVTEAMTLPSAPANKEDKKISEFKFGIQDRAEDGTRGQISLGVTYSGVNPITASLDATGKLNPDFAAALRHGLSTRYRNVVLSQKGLTGLNDEKEFKSVIIKDNGQVQITAHTDYNAYVKTITETSLYGKNQVDGKHVYFANSQVIIDRNPLMDIPMFEDRSLAELVTSTKDDTEINLDLFETEAVNNDDLNIELFNLTPQTVKPIVKGVGSAATVENLEELKITTPSANYNGKTVNEVYNRLQKLGITTLENGFNPFYKCG
jgi:hypothetical protein